MFAEGLPPKTQKDSFKYIMLLVSGCLVKIEWLCLIRDEANLPA